MTTDTQPAEKLTAEHESRLQSIIDDVLKGIAEGAKEGLAQGLKKGGREALESCLFQSPGKAGPAGIKGIMKAIPQAVIKASVKKGAQPILQKTAEQRMQQACQKLIEKLKKEGVRPSPEQIGLILEFIQRSQQEAVKEIVEKLPKNPLFSAIAGGMRAALDESLKKSLANCRTSLQKAFP